MKFRSKLYWESRQKIDKLYFQYCIFYSICFKTSWDPSQYSLSVSKWPQIKHADLRWFSDKYRDVNWRFEGRVSWAEWNSSSSSGNCVPRFLALHAIFAQLIVAKTETQHHHLKQHCIMYKITGKQDSRVRFLETKTIKLVNWVFFN